MVEDQLRVLSIPDVHLDLRGRKGMLQWMSANNDPSENLRVAIENIQSTLFKNDSGLAAELMDNKFPLTDKRKRELEYMILSIVESNDYLDRLLKGPVGAVEYGTDFLHFRKRRGFTLAVVFRDWNLFKDALARPSERTPSARFLMKRVEEARPIRICIDRDDREVYLNVVDLREGRDIIFKIISGELKPAEAPAIHIGHLDSRKSGRSADLYIGSDMPIITFEKAVVDAYRVGGGVVLVPFEDDLFGYKWLGVYGCPVEGDKVSTQLDSIRIDDQKKSLTKQGWYGPDRQAFFDYISGLVELADPNQLPEFLGKIGGNGNVYLGRVRGQYISVLFNGKGLSAGADVVIKPRFDNNRGYFWIEGYSVEDSMRGKYLFSKRILLGEEFSMREWNGLELQSIVDWIYGKLPFDKVLPAKVLIDSETKHSFVILDARLRIGLDGNNKFDKSRPVYLIPNEWGPYKWLEVQQDNEDSSDRRVISRCLVSVGGPMLVGGWHGLERQLLIDYIDGKVNFESLRSIVIKWSRKGRGSVFSCHGKPVELVLRRRGFMDEGEVILQPSLVQEDGDIVFNAIKEDMGVVHQAAVKLDHTLLSFRAILQFKKKSSVSNGWTVDLTKDRGSVEGSKSIAFGDLSPGVKEEINREFWRLLHDDPDSRMSVVDFAKKYLEEKSWVLGVK